jgi:hypothetical protein
MRKKSKKHFLAKAYMNKKNKQVSIVIPKKKLNWIKGKTPKKIKLKIEGIEW